MAFTFAAFAYIVALIIDAFLIFFAIFHVSAHKSSKSRLWSLLAQDSTGNCITLLVKMRKQSSFSRNFVFIWLIFMLTDHCFRRVENGLQEPHRPVRIPQSSCSAGVSASPNLKPQLIVKPTNQIIEIKSGTSFTFSSTSCSWLLGSGSAFCSTPLWSATTSTGGKIDKRQKKSHFEIPFSDIWTDPWCLEPVSMTPPPSWMQTPWTSARLFSIFNPKKMNSSDSTFVERGLD